MRRTLLLGLVLAAAAPTAASAATHPDRSFGNGRGYVTLDLPGGSAVAYAATATSDDGTVVAGQAIPANGPGQVLVAKYDKSGKLDDGFSGDGIYRTSLPGDDGPFLATSIAQDAHGRLVVAGAYGLGSVLVLRLTADGKLDEHFGRNGYATVGVGGIGQSVAIAPDGHIVVGASNSNENGRPMVVVRLTARGALDHTFGTNGKTEVLFWNANQAASAGVSGLAITHGGNIVGSGHLDYIGTDGHGSAGVFSLSSGGRLVPGYGTNGGTEVAFPNPNGSFAQWLPCAMTLSPSGRATVTGDGSTAAGNAVLATRLTAAGAPDPSFGPAGDGRVVIPGASGGDDTTCGAAYAGGTFTLGAGSSFAQILKDGTPNGAFAPGGITTIGTPDNVGINAVALPSNDRAVLAGFAGSDLYVARYVLPD
jgi:uncharacterized delta-60 repeat protein